MEITAGSFAAGLNAQIGKHGDDTIESIEKTDEGYIVTVSNYKSEKAKLLINAGVAEAAVDDALVDEIAVYSIMENVAYMAIAARNLMFLRKLPDVPLPLLVTAIIKFAEEFDQENGTDAVGEDTVKAINTFVEDKLIERFKQ